MTENIQLDKDGDNIHCSVGLYKLFLEKQNEGLPGMDAFSVYMHLMFTARLQETRQVYANNTYLRDGLHMGEKSIKNAKKLLAELGLIEYVQGKPTKGDPTFDRVYIILKFYTPATSTNSIGISQPETETAGSNLTPLTAGSLSARAVKNDKFLKKEVKCLKKKEEEELHAEGNGQEQLNELERDMPNSSSSLPNSFKDEEQERRITECRRIIGAINEQQDEEWKTLLYHNTDLQAEFERLEEGGELNVTNLLQLAKQENSPSHFFTALRKYKGGKPVTEEENREKTGEERYWDMMDRADEKAAAKKAAAAKAEMEAADNEPKLTDEEARQHFAECKSRLGINETIEERNDREAVKTSEPTAVPEGCIF